MDRIDITRKSGRLIGLCLFWLGNLGFAVFLLAAPWHQSELAVIITCVLCGIILLPLVVFMLAQVLNGLLHPVLIQLDANGMTDHRISRLHRPWAEISWQPYPSPEYAEALLISANYPPGSVFWPYRLLARFYALLDLPAYPVLTMGTGLSGIDLAEAFTRYKSPVPEEGAARRRRPRPNRPVEPK